ncbi:MAG: hypothetical protein WC028_24820 [Candidatus Obscuribacterales bacterium]
MATIATFGLALPALAQDSIQGGNWTIAKANVERFLGLDDKTLAALFGCKSIGFECNIDMDENTILRFDSASKVGAFAFLPQSAPSMEGCFGVDPNYDHPKLRSETFWTGAKRKDQKEYWTIIKANLDKFIGMSGEEIAALLGPERCSSKPWNRIDYRIGDAGLTFYLKDGKVEKFRFSSDRYIPGT